MKQFSTKQIGDIGEEYAVKYLKKKHYKILERNYRIRNGEIDIIACKKDVLVFVEVKTRHSQSLSQPFEAVDRRKRAAIVRTAKMYLCRNRLDVFCRFDVCEVFVNRETLKPEKIVYIDNAFEEENPYEYH